jgi:hypothetical protein
MSFMGHHHYVNDCLRRGVLAKHFVLTVGEMNSQTGLADKIQTSFTCSLSPSTTARSDHPPQALCQWRKGRPSGYVQAPA